MSDVSSHSQYKMSQADKSDFIDDICKITHGSAARVFMLTVGGVCKKKTVMTLPIWEKPTMTLPHSHLYNNAWELMRRWIKRQRV